MNILTDIVVMCVLCGIPLGRSAMDGVWTNMCTLDHNTNSSNAYLSCKIAEGELWALGDLRNWSRSLDNDTRVFVDLVCESEGQVCLPWPYRSPNLYFLKVRGCVNTCYYKEYSKEKFIENIPDTLTIFEAYEMTIELTLKDLIILDVRHMSPALDCGPVMVETYIYQGTRSRFIDSDIDFMMLNETEITNNFTDKVRSLGDVKHKCRYTNLRLYDVSRRVDASSSSIYALLVNSYFPQLETLNLSSTELQAFPPMLQAWRTRIPNLQTLDLSLNNISRFSIATDLTTTHQGPWSINLTRNNIKTIGSEEMRSFRHSGVIDVRENPLHCDCAMKEFVHLLSTQSSPEAAGLDPQYSYLWNLKCSTPSSLKGIPLSELSPETLCNPDAGAYRAVISVLIALVVAIFVLVLAVILIVVVRR